MPIETGHWVAVARCIAAASCAALALLLTLPAHAQAPKGAPVPIPPPPPEGVESVAVERSAMFEVTPVTGILKETVQNGQQLVWRAGGTSTGERRFEITDLSVAFLRNETPGEVKITFSGHVSAFGWRPIDEAKINVIVRTRGGASIYSWLFNVAVQCGDNNRTLTPVTQQVPSDLAANLFNSVGAVEISEFREPNTPRLRARRCRSQVQ